MSDTEERNEPIFNQSESEISDLNDDQGSDEEYNNNNNEQEIHENVNKDDTTASNNISAVNVQKLPSFKKRERTKEEEAQLQKIKQELKQRRGQEGRDDQPDEPLDPEQIIRNEVAEAFERALKSGVKKRKKRTDDEDLERTMDEELHNLRERMKVAAETDVIANQQQKPAIAKLKMIDEVKNTLNNSSLFDSILDNQLLDAIRVWLEPLPDRALPSLEIQNELLDILDKLPAAAEHLRESGIGKIVFFYKKTSRAEPTIQRKADHLVAKWTRLVLKRSESYRERRHESLEYNKEEMLHKRKRFRMEDATKDIDETKLHVNIPLPVAPDYDVAPRSTVRADKSRSAKNHPYKRLKTKMRSLTQNNQRKKAE
ncbi:unnamed protein product [Cunninghamella blakesleeana]